MATADKTVIVTGGNSGLGFECAGAILREKDRCHVIIAGRSLERCQAAARRLAHDTGNPGVEAMVFDLGSLAAVRRFASNFSVAGLPPSRALVCNAGIENVGATRRTEDGFEGTFGVNRVPLMLDQRIDC